jgi:hypothetical protein
MVSPVQHDPTKFNSKLITIYAPEPVVEEAFQSDAEESFKMDKRFLFFLFLERGQVTFPLGINKNPPSAKKRGDIGVLKALGVKALGVALSPFVSESAKYNSQSI